MPGIKYGSTDIKQIYYGSTPIKSVYYGSTKIRPTGPDITGYTRIATMSYGYTGTTRAVFFSTDGTKIIAKTTSNIYTYTLSTPFDVTTRGSASTRQQSQSAFGNMYPIWGGNKIIYCTTWTTSSPSFYVYGTSNGIRPPTGSGTSISAMQYGVLFGQSADTKNLYGAISVNSENTLLQEKFSSSGFSGTVTWGTKAYTPIYSGSYIRGVYITKDGGYMFVGESSGTTLRIIQYKLTTPRSINDYTYEKELSVTQADRFSFSDDEKYLITFKEDSSPNIKVFSK